MCVCNIKSKMCWMCKIEAFFLVVSDFWIPVYMNPYLRRTDIGIYPLLAKIILNVLACFSQWFAACRTDECVFEIWIERISTIAFDVQLSQFRKKWDVMIEFWSWSVALFPEILVARKCVTEACSMRKSRSFDGWRYLHIGSGQGQIKLRLLMRILLEACGGYRTNHLETAEGDGDSSISRYANIHVFCCVVE